MATNTRKSSRVATGQWRNNAPPLISRASNISTEYPRVSRSFVGSIHDARRGSGLLANNNNFSETTEVDVFQTSRGSGLTHLALDETTFAEYLQENGGPSPPHENSLRVICCLLESRKDSSFNFRVSLSSDVARQLLTTLDVTPHFIGPLFGEPDYGAPGDFATLSEAGHVQRLEFCCQQPRWAIHRKSAPWCIYMTHSLATGATTYIVVCDREQSRFDVVKERLADIFNADRQTRSSLGDSINPFFLHCLISHEVFLDAVPSITQVRHQLYDALDRVDRYAETDADGRKRTELEELTIKLHIVSQETDRMYANVEMSGMIVGRLTQAHQRYRKVVEDDVAMRDSLEKTSDALAYLFETIESQKRWLHSYKSRKDIAMNLVFNLVTQQDSATGTMIAREAKADGSSMRVIATLTMVFLPGTFMSSVFGMAVMQTAHWWLYVALTLPLTFMVFFIWWLWQKFEGLSDLHQKIRRRSPKTEKEHLSEGRPQQTA
ncbi:hypothetical protein K491DRAFT_720142 [Lophiostoma macrostomum CBS 122681]|uniref:Cora-domain-containing protein n=1 Tax=Lophiostoma macrostomum CBS 122681 TaxID=1314788 RepID=A0A6A6SXC8_9PLEO|nr:hypothetical protein K491DRAFT_720142 [Lophiostoma macrostomum CBS 122681]